MLCARTPASLLSNRSVDLLPGATCQRLGRAAISTVGFVFAFECRTPRNNWPVEVGSTSFISEEIVVDPLDLEQRACLVDRCLGKRQQKRGQPTQKSNQNECSFTPAQDSVVLKDPADRRVISGCRIQALGTAGAPARAGVCFGELGRFHAFLLSKCFSESVMRPAPSAAVYGDAGPNSNGGVEGSQSHTFAAAVGNEQDVVGL